VRDLSTAWLEAIHAETTDKVFLHLLTITHADLTTPIRLTDDRADIVSRSNTYTAFPFSISLPPSIENEVPSVRLVIGNVSRELMDEIRTITTPPTISLELISHDAPDTVEIGPLDFKLKSADYDAQTIEASIGFEEDFLTEPFPAARFTPQGFPALFAGVDE